MFEQYEKIQGSQNQKHPKRGVNLHGELHQAFRRRRKNAKMFSGAGSKWRWRLKLGIVGDRPLQISGYPKERNKKNRQRNFLESRRKPVRIYRLFGICGFSCQNINDSDRIKPRVGLRVSG